MSGTLLGLAAGVELVALAPTGRYENVVRLTIAASKAFEEGQRKGS